MRRELLSKAKVAVSVSPASAAVPWNEARRRAFVCASRYGIESVADRLPIGNAAAAPAAAAFTAARVASDIESLALMRTLPSSAGSPAAPVPTRRRLKRYGLVAGSALPAG